MRGNPTVVQRLVSGSAFATTTSSYDTTGQMVSAQDPNGNVTTYSYADNFFTDNGSDPPSGGGHGEGAGTNAYLTQVTPPNVNGVSHATYAGYYYWTGQKALSKDPNSQTTYMHYLDPFSRPTETDFPDGGWSLTQYSSTTQSDTYTGVAIGSTPSQYCTGCQHAQTMLDTWARATQRDIPNDPGETAIAAMTFDANSRPASVTNPYWSGGTINSTSLTYDGLNRRATLTQPDSSTVSFYYGASLPSGSNTSQLCSAATYGAGYPVYRVDEAGKKSEVWEDGFGRRIEADEPDASNNLTRATCYLYDANNNLLQVVAPNGATRSFTYDGLSRPTSATTPEGGAVSYSYDGNGNIITRVAPKENQTNSSVTVTTTYSYDALNRLTQKSYNDNTTPTAQYFYDQSSAWGLTLTNPIGRLTTTQTIPPGSSNAQTATLSAYDPMGRVTLAEECQPQNCSGAPNLAVQYAYDLAGDITSQQEQDYSGAFNFTLTYVYDNIGELAAVKSSLSDYYHPGTLLSNATYDAARQLTADTLGNGLPETFAYNSRMWLSSIAAGFGDPPGYVYTLSLGYAGDGSVTSADDSVNGDSTYTYDNLNRLATMSSPYNPSGCYGLSWTYDSAGNRTAQSVTSGSCPTFSAAVNSNNQLANSPYQYDAAGNMTNDGTNAYAFDAEGRVLTVGSGYAVYVYDVFGRRIENTLSGSSDIYLYDLAGRRIGAVSTSGQDEDHRIYAGSRLLAVYPGGDTTYFYNSDQLGTDRVVTDRSRTVQETCTSLPYGDSHSCTRGDPPVRFAGFDIDGGTGLYHAPARYYSPSLGRFMTPDPFGTPPAKPATCSLGGPPADGMTDTLARPESLNRYAYVVDSPATAVDPSGGLEQEPAGPPPDTGVGGFGCDPTDLFCAFVDAFGGGGGGGGGGPTIDYCAGHLAHAHWPAVYCNGINTATGSVQLLNAVANPPAVAGTLDVTVETSANVRVAGGAGKVLVSPRLVITVPYAVTGGMGAFGEIWLFVRYTCNGKPYEVSGRYTIHCGSAA